MGIFSRHRLYIEKSVNCMVCVKMWSVCIYFNTCRIWLHKLKLSKFKILPWTLKWLAWPHHHLHHYAAQTYLYGWSYIGAWAPSWPLLSWSVSFFSNLLIIFLWVDLKRKFFQRTGSDEKDVHNYKMQFICLETWRLNFHAEQRSYLCKLIISRFVSPNIVVRSIKACYSLM